MPSIKGTLAGLGAVGLGAAGMVGRGLGMGNVMAAGLAGGALFKGGYDKATAKKDDDDDDEAKIEARAAWVASDKILQSIYKDIVEIKNHLQKGIIPESQSKEIAIQENARFDEVLKVLQSEGLFMGPEAEEGEKPSSFLDKIKSFFNFAKFGGFFAKFLGIMKLGKLWSIMGIAVRLLARFFWPVLLGGFIISTVWTNWDKISQVWKDTMTAIKDKIFGWMDKIKEAWDMVVDAWGMVQDQWEKVQNFLSDSLTQLFSPNEGEEEMDLGFQPEDETMIMDDEAVGGVGGEEEDVPSGFYNDEEQWHLDQEVGDADDHDPMEGKDWMVTDEGELVIVMPLEPEDESIEIPKEDQFDESMIPTDVPRRATPGKPDESWKDLGYIMSLIEDEQGPRVDEAELDRWIKSGDGMFVTDYQGAADDSHEEVTSYGWKAQAVDKFMPVADITPASLTEDTITEEEKEAEIAQVVANVEAGIPALVASVLDKDVPGAETQQEAVQPESILGPVHDSREVPEVFPQDGVLPSIQFKPSASEGDDDAAAITPRTSMAGTGSGTKQQSGSTGAGTTSSGSGSSQSAGSAVPILQSSTSTMATSATPTPNVALEPSIEIVKKTKKHNVANTSVSSARVGYHKRHGTVNPHVEGDISTAII